MAPTSESDSRPTDLSSFVALAYLITWVLLGPWFYFYNSVWNRTVPRWMWFFVPLIFLGGYGPSIAALTLTWARQGRLAAVALLRSLSIWRVHYGWYAFVLFLPLLVTACAALLSELSPVVRTSFDAGASLSSVPLILVLALPFGPLGEELGWRGYALPRLLERYGPWRASVTLGVVWTFWHAPMIFLMPGAALPEFMPITVGAVLLYLAEITAESCIFTFVYCFTRKSVLIAVLLHLTFNTSEAVFLRGVPEPSVDILQQIYFIKVALLWLASVGMLGFPRRRIPTASRL